MSLAEFLLSLPSELEEGRYVEMEDASVPLNDDAWHASPGSPSHKKARTTGSTLGLNINDDFFTVPELQQRPLPREDGYVESEKDAWVARERPFGREFLNEQQERHKILAQNKNYRFVQEVAGALRKEPLQVMEEEDLARVMRERAQERREAEAEVRRTKLTINEKSQAVRQLEALLAQEHERYDRAQAARTGPTAQLLTELSEQLIDRDPVGIVQLMQQLQEYQLLARIQPGDIRNGVDQTEAIARVERFDEGENEELEATMKYFAASLGKRYYSFLVYVYYRDFVDNADSTSMRDSFAAKLAYIDRVLGRLGSDPDDKQVAMPVILTTPENPPPLIDWDVYRGTETLNMNYYLSLSLFTATEQTLLAHLGTRAYNTETMAALMGFVYDTGDTPDFRLPQYKRLLPLIDLVPGLGYTALQLLVRSHLLWLHYSEVGLTDLVTVLFDNTVTRSFVAKKIHDLANGLVPSLQNLLDSAYTPIVNDYLKQLREYMTKQQSLTGQKAVFAVPDGELALGGPQDAYRQSDALVRDAQFRDYLQKGNAIFATRPPLVGQRATTDSESTTLRLEAPPAQYPVLILHSLFRQYQRYLAAYTRYSERQLQLGEEALGKARAKMASLLGDERVDRTDRSDPLLYQQRKSFTTQPINSGFVQFKAEIWALIKRAWHNTQTYATKLRGLPLEGFHCEAAFASGLCTRFCEYVAALYAYKDLSINQQYNSQHHTAHCHKAVWEAFRPLHAYSWAPMGVTADGDQDYYISGGSPTTGGGQWGTVITQAQYNLAPF